MHVFVNATYIAALLLSPSTPQISRMGDWLHTSEVLSKLSAIMAVQRLDNRMRGLTQRFNWSLQM